MSDFAHIPSLEDADLATHSAIDRATQPVDSEEAPRLPFAVVGIGASAGGLEAVTEFIKAMPPDSGMAFILVQHLPPDRESMMADILGRHTKMPVAQVEHGMRVEPNHLYVIRPGHTLTIHNGKLNLGAQLEKAGHSRPVDDLFRSLAIEQRERGIAIVLSGMGSNGTSGTQAIKAVGGLCMVQDPETALFPSMPRHVIDAGCADYVLRPADMPEMLISYARHPYAKGERTDDSEVTFARERQHLREVLAVLRTRTSQDFSGYKKPTVVRRVQRRMGLNRLDSIAEYAKFIRQSPAEVTALADDLLIHVTGFFRDPDAWEALQTNVIVPLVASRESGGTIRCWVTACSSGEEAYSMAILLVEEAKRVDKLLDIKVFATDLAERSLKHARAGLYPGGIESEVTPERLMRFFIKEDAMYRVRHELREHVIFAPQNVLQDPPFSHIDIISCRNLLIYLEPDVQQRVLLLLHFGLREGGMLFLGSSESASGKLEDLFEAVDKRNRLFRRVGPTRHGMIDFPAPHGFPRSEGVRRPVVGASGPTTVRPSMMVMTSRALLENHTPAAVTVDRDGNIAYYHGDTEPFVSVPRGEPTRDLMQLVRDNVRGSVRTAVQRARAKGFPVTVLDGVMEGEQGERHRIAITASPLDPKNAPEFIVVSFQVLAEPLPALPDESVQHRSDVLDELRRVRDELQSTVEELQTSNEELKASHEEIVSTNEELQSANEELETSREEMQSLNEELTTVNAQLTAKVEEHQSVSSDLTSLLASTNIAVLFLDTKFRIRRFTPQVLDLLEVLPGDIGRPMSDLARKFDDPNLLTDARNVLDRLSSVEREVPAHSGQWYLRRATPYRTSDNRIDGVVIAFIDITDRRKAEDALRISEERLRGFADNSADGLWMADASELYLEYVSPVFETLWGVRREIVLGRPARWEQFIHPEDKALVNAHIEKLRSGFPNVAEYRVVRQSDQKFRHVRDTGFPIFDNTSGVRRIGGITQDVTEERQTSERLRDTENRLRRAIEVDNVGILFFKATGELTYCNPAFLRMSGYSADDLTQGNLNWEKLTPSEFKEQSSQAMKELESLGRTKPYEKQFLREDGSRWWALVADARLNDEERVEFVVDTSETRKAEVALQESEERFKLLVAGARDLAMIMIDPVGHISMWNEGATRVLGLAEKEAIGQMIDIIFTPEDRENGIPAQERANAVADGRAPDERWHLRKDGERLWGSGMTVALRSPDGALRGFVKVMRDETLRKRSEEALQASRDSAELANRIKDEFLATLSHELRTPLSSILIWSKLLRQSVRGDQEAVEGLDAISRSAEAQKQLIDDLLDTARITSGKLQLAMREMALTPMVQEAINAVRPTAEARGVEIKADLGSDVGVVRADPDRLRQVVWNLLSNAVKFTSEGGEVEVGLWRKGRGVEIKVTDNGKGIDPQFLPYVFEPFRQADSSSTRTYGGLGLGLAICKQLVEQHGGTISAASDGPGTGATFSVQLPLPKVRQTSARLVGSPPKPDSEPHSTAVFTGKRLLLVEDDPETQAALVRLLGSFGLDVIAASSAAEAMTLFEASPPNLIVSDIGMAEEDGYSLIQRIRAVESKAMMQPVPAIALTAFAREEDRDRALEAGFNRHVGKPVDPEQLLAILSQTFTNT